MEQGDLLNLLENLLGPATAGVAAQAYDDETSASYPESYPNARADLLGASGGQHPSMTGFLSGAMPIGIAFVETISLTVVRVNKMLLRMLGVRESVESAQGRPLEDVAPALRSPELVAALNQVAVTGLVFSAILTDGSVAATGEPIYRRWTISPLRQGSRSRDLLLVTALDVTEQIVTRRRMEEAVAAAQEQSRRLQEHSNFMQERIRRAEEQAAVRLQQVIDQHEERVRIAAEQTGKSLDQLRQLEGELRLTPEQQRRLESAALLANNGARAELEQGQRELEAARQEIERIRRAEGQPSASGGSLDTSALATLIHDLTAGAGPSLDRAARTVAEALGDTCGIFLANGEGRLLPIAFHHPAPQVASRLTSFYTQRPLQPGEGLVGQVARQGIGAARESVAAGEMSYVLPGLGEDAQALGVISAACAPLRGTLAPVGAILLLSTQRAYGGSDRSFDESVLGALNLYAAAIALAAQNASLAREVSAADAQREAIFAGMTDGVAIYDRLGRLRHVNAVAEQLLTAPDANTSAHPMLQGFLDERGAPLSGDNLPWMRVLRGEGTQGAVERVIAAWDSGAQRSLLLRALPARDGSGVVSHAVVLLRLDQQAANGAAPQAAPIASQSEAIPDANTSEAREICERVARAYGRAKQRRIEVRLPQRAVLLAAPAAEVERAVASLIEAAGMAFPASAPLQMSLVVEPAETATARPRRYSAGPAPEYAGPSSGGRERAYVATIQLTGPLAGATLAAAAPFVEQTRVRAASFGGMAWVYEDGGGETHFLLRAPVASIGR